MRTFVIILFTFLIATFVYAQETEVNNNLENKATETAVKKAVDQENNNSENLSTSVEVPTSGAPEKLQKIEIKYSTGHKSKKDKTREPMGSASTSGPPQEIEEMQVQPAEPDEDVKKVLSDPQPIRAKDK
jgi:hypothetical protein